MHVGNIVRSSNEPSQQLGSIRKLATVAGPYPANFHGNRHAPVDGTIPGSFSINAIRINTYEKSPYNPSTINTYKNARLKVVQNQHLQKNRGVPPFRKHLRAILFCRTHGEGCALREFSEGGVLSRLTNHTFRSLK